MTEPTTNDLKLFLLRHGETEWALNGKHTGRSDIPLTENGRAQARSLKVVLAKIPFSAVLTSPLSRAKETATLAGLDKQLRVDDNLMEVDYGDFDGKTTSQIRASVPDWTVWTHPCPNGETLAQVAERAASVIKHAASVGGNIALFSHGHMLRILTMTWLGLPPAEGKHIMLDTGTLSILCHERETPAIRLWNAPIDMYGFVNRLN